MRFLTYFEDGAEGLAIVKEDGAAVGLRSGQDGYPGSLINFLTDGLASIQTLAERLMRGYPVDIGSVEARPPIQQPGKILCVGLNYRSHAAEAGIQPPNYPTVFARFASGLIGNGANMILPSDSDQLDYEGELVAVIGKAGRRIPRERALDHVAGYSLFNDGSIRDAQLRTSQWTLGKNYDGTGACGPYFVTADSLPPGCKGLTLETRLNGVRVQRAAIGDMIFDVASLVSLLSDAFALHPGDMIVTGTPSGVGMAAVPPAYLKKGDVCEVEVNGLGILRNQVFEEAPSSSELSQLR
jgi:acylpyruvate hydrolase